MKKIVLALAAVFLVLFSLSGCAVLTPKPTPAPVPAPEVTSNGPTTVFVYQEKMADGETWCAYGKGSVFSRDPRPGDTLFLNNAEGKSFRVRVIQVFRVPPGSKTKGVWIEFWNLTLEDSLVKGELPVRQPLTGPGFVVVR